MSEEFLESTLIQQAIAGDRTALSQLLLEYYDDLQRAVVQQLSRDPHEALSPEDVLQQTFVRAAMGVCHFEARANGSFRAWLLTIAGNLVRDAQKRRRRERRSVHFEPPAGEASGSDGPRIGVDQLAGDTTSPSMRVHRRDSLEQIRRAMEGLPADQREVIRRHYLEHESLEQIAAAMHRSKDAVRGISHRARQNLRSFLGHSSRFFSN